VLAAQTNLPVLTTPFQVRALFDRYDSDADNALSLNELAVLLQEIGYKITALPAVSAYRTPQVQTRDLGVSLSFRQHR
jgi:phosphoribosylcarboxyaminoimidazole (NCAIR) mutase